MFTGIVDHLGEIMAVHTRSHSLSLDIKTAFKACRPGESIAVNGICLTVTDYKKGQFSVDLSPETVACTTAADWKKGKRIHLERALRVGDRLGGHWVMGHVDSCVQVSGLHCEGDCLFLKLTGVQKQHARYLVEKGCVTLDGVSLTINRVSVDGFDVMLIPQTLKITHFSQLASGEHLNIEYDYLLKWAARDQEWGCQQ